MRRGVMYAGMAGALWGMVLMVPELLPEFNPMLLSSVRYLMVGVISLLLALPMARQLRQLTLGDAWMLLRLAVIGNLVYFICLVAAIQRLGVAPASLIVGVLPLTITLYGRNDSGAVPLARLVGPLALILAGMLCINLETFAFAPGDVGDKLMGLFYALAALACWTWYAAQNSRYLKQCGHFDSHQWSVLCGVVTGLASLVMVAALALWQPQSLQVEAPMSRWWLFWACSLGCAVLGSWLAMALWNAASKRLPLTLSGQLIVFETLFALLYAFLWRQTGPSVLEAAAIVLVIGGVLWSMRQHEAPRELAKPVHS
ncbi:DMT family transporter [Pseudomonas guariconensis]|uniref:DMT family transporter n=1 Tax=Pseudomonas TaxID=286 RepID=UPI001CE4246B|nr:MULTISPECIES: DMT family transporter [Pseudomonas]MCO7517190.1 DMT family transporter [Pseudomonas putida]MCO7597184.1 DMT family transporter [Pseudomonas guariconensis]MCO7607471.1 DMT family transporter [Pseudomonas guariconensis]MCO7634407.1 DMT family transporter [Pseudomonas guariconensis]MCU7222670.1 DMT family transporter [Pseudomonas brassicacearum]